MATPAVVTPCGVPTTLNHFTALDNDPPHRYVETPVGKPATNVGSSSNPQPAVVHDVRRREAEFSLNENGFWYVHWLSVEKGCTDDEVIRVKEKYYPEVERIMKEVAGAKRVYTFDHTIRRQPKSELSDPKSHGPAVSSPRRHSAPPPVAPAHHQRPAAAMGSRTPSPTSPLHLRTGVRAVRPI